jgi:D-alanine-D-alanine ligase-like ATP-grasp enzyme
MPINVSIKPYYAYTTRLLVDLFHNGELPHVSGIDVEPVYGYVGRIEYHNGSVRLFRGTDLNINRHAAAEMAKDKGYTKYFLRRLNYNTPSGQTFVTPRYLAIIQPHFDRYDFHDHVTIDDIPAYVESTIGYPCYVKPNDGSQGKNVDRCDNREELDAAVANICATCTDLILVEAMVDLPEYRVVVYDGQVICAYGRHPFQVTGDGNSTIVQLIAVRQAEFESLGRSVKFDATDPAFLRRLERYSYTLDTVLADGDVLRLNDVANLSVGGEAVDVTGLLADAWAAFCVELAQTVGLTLCGVDLACADIEDGQSDYSIIEINSTPSLSHYASLGSEQNQRVRDFYRRIFDNDA